MGSYLIPLTSSMTKGYDKFQTQDSRHPIWRIVEVGGFLIFHFSGYLYKFNGYAPLRL